MNYATLQDIEALWRPLNDEERIKAEALLPVVSDSLRQAAHDLSKDIDKMLVAGALLPNVIKSVTVDVVARALMTPTDDAPMTQYSQSALGYTVSGTYLVPGGGLFIKRAELARLGLKRQQVRVVEMYDKGDDG